MDCRGDTHESGIITLTSTGIAVLISSSIATATSTGIGVLSYSSIAAVTSTGIGKLLQRNAMTEGELNRLNEALFSSLLC